MGLFDCVTNRRKKHHARAQSIYNQSINFHLFQLALLSADSSYIDPCLHHLSTPPLSSAPSKMAVVEGFMFIFYSKCSVSSKIVSVQAKSEQGGWISVGGPQRRFIRGGSAPRCNPFFFYIAF